jgi:protein AbiQ
VDEEYIDYLKKYECNKRGFTCVPNVSYENINKFTFGAVLNVNNVSNFVPVS